MEKEVFGHPKHHRLHGSVAVRALHMYAVSIGTEMQLQVLQLKIVCKLFSADAGIPEDREDLD